MIGRGIMTWLRRNIFYRTRMQERTIKAQRDHIETLERHRDLLQQELEETYRGKK